MTASRKKLLDQAHSAILEIIMYDYPIDKIHEFIVEDVMGNGTIRAITVRTIFNTTLGLIF